MDINVTFSKELNSIQKKHIDELGVYHIIEEQTVNNIEYMMEVNGQNKSKNLHEPTIL